MVTPFPGHYCPGLIEASALPKAMVANTNFPGHYCPGLIEACQPRGVHSSRAPFRGITAPASLKPLDAGAVDIAGAGFPGHYCPGLIEAIKTFVRYSKLIHLSGALLPRPH